MTSVAPPRYLQIHSPFIGRLPELAFLKAQHDAVIEGAGGQLTFISGQPGVGKTRLAQELGRYASGQGSLVIEGSYLRDGSASSEPWVKVLRTCLNSFPRDQVVPLIAPYRAELTDVLPEFTKSLGLGPAPAPPLLLPSAQLGRLYDGLADLICQLSALRPLVLLFNDLQWASGFAVMIRLAQRMDACRVFLLGTYREQEFQEQPVLVRQWAELNRSRRLTQIHLEPLSEEETAQLVAHYLGAGPAEHLRSPVYRQTRGNPFFIEEALRTLVESGAVRGREVGGEVGWEVVEPSQVTLPESMRLVVLERVDRLGESTRDILTHAWVLGQQFSFQALQGLVDRPEDELLDALDRALRAQLLVDCSVAGDERYAFTDDQVQEVLYETIPGPWRRRYHLRAGQALERLLPGNQEDYLEELVEARS